jgi:CRISPR/Cas system-associated protein Cas5 (RAMP superfamily)
LRFVGPSKNGAAKKLSPELGNEVSGHVEKLSRKIHMLTAKSSVVGVESVYL